jgi:hypothetical protein
MKERTTESPVWMGKTTYGRTARRISGWWRSPRRRIPRRWRSPRRRIPGRRRTTSTRSSSPSTNRPGWMRRQTCGEPPTHIQRKSGRCRRIHHPMATIRRGQHYQRPHEECIPTSYVISHLYSRPLVNEWVKGVNAWLQGQVIRQRWLTTDERLWDEVQESFNRQFANVMEQENAQAKLAGGLKLE